MKVSKKMKKVLTIMGVVSILMMLNLTVFAVNGAATTGAVSDPNLTFDAIIKFIAGWIGKLALVVAFIGAVQLGFSIKNDDADAKTKGLRTLASGIIVFAITGSLTMFGIV